MNIDTTNERGVLSALDACPRAAVSRTERPRRTAAPVMPYQGIALPAGSNGTTGVAGAVQKQFVPLHPGDTSSRPPA